MSAPARSGAPLRWETLAPPGRAPIEQARARNNSWYLSVPRGDRFDVRYASQSANALIGSGLSSEAAKAAAEAHADRYDTRADETGDVVVSHPGGVVDIHQLRSWIFELYEPLEDERQYIVFDRERGNLLIDAPVFGERPLRLIRGVGGAAILLVTNAARGADAARYRDALGLQIAAAEADAGAVPGGVDVVVKDGDLLRADARVHRVSANGEGATVALVRRAGGVLFCGDLDLGSDAARDLTKLAFSAVLSSRRAPIWGAGRDTVLQLQRELPAPKKRFGIFLQAPWDRAYRGRLQDQMTPNPLVPQDETAPREAGMGPSTFIAADTVRDKIERAKRPAPATERTAAVATAAPAAAKPGRPRSFAEDWQAPATAAPPTTRANPQRDIQPHLQPGSNGTGSFRPVPLGAAFQALPIETIAGLPAVDQQWGGIDLAPDGSEVAFAWNRSDSYEIYSAPLAGDRIFQLTEAGARSVWPRWSPDGRTVAFLRDTGGSEHLGIWTVDRDGEHEHELIAAAGVTHRDLAWSPDGRTIACVANHGGGFGIHLVDVATGKGRGLTDGSTDARPRFSPDGRWIVFEAHRSDRRTDLDLHLVSFAGGTPVRIDTRGGLPGDSFDARFSPDGRQLAFTTNARGRREIAIADLDGTAVRAVAYLTENPFEESVPVWRPDQRGVVYLHDQDAAVAVHRAFTVSHAATPVSDLPGRYAWPQVGPDSETVVATFSTSRRPTDVWVRDPLSVDVRPLTDSLDSAGGRLDPRVLVEPTHVRYPSADGREIPALLYVPHAEVARGDPPAAILYIHGGPTGQHYRGWDATPQVFANRGFVVLAPNIRGSTGYGRDHQEANRSDWGGADLADVVAGTAWLVGEGIADGAHLGICGGSYGGYLTLLALGRHPELFAAGASVVGVVSLETLYRTTRGDLREYLDREIGPLAGNEAWYRERSPITYADRITAPLLVLQGANDPRVPRAEAQQVVAVLARSGTPYAYHEYPDEGHGFTRTPNRIDELRRVTEWFERYLTPLILRHL